MRIVGRQYFARGMLLVVPTVPCPAEEAEKRLKAREWHVSGLVVCRASSSSCGNCFSSMPGYWINQSLEKFGNRSCVARIKLSNKKWTSRTGKKRRRQHRKSILTRKVNKTPSKTTDQESGSSGISRGALGLINHVLVLMLSVCQS